MSLFPLREKRVSRMLRCAAKILSLAMIDYSSATETALSRQPFFPELPSLKSFFTRGHGTSGAACKL